MKSLPMIMAFGALGALGYYFWTTYQGVPEMISRPATGPVSGFGVQNYTVKSGDTLGRIAIQHRILLKTLFMLNPQFAPTGERSPDFIVPGESIRVK